MVNLCYNIAVIMCLERSRFANIAVFYSANRSRFSIQNQLFLGQQILIYFGPVLHKINIRIEQDYNKESRLHLGAGPCS